MRFKIKNIAKVEHADILLDGITIVAGSNGSGKSTISKSLFAIMYSNENWLVKASLQKNRSIDKICSDFAADNNIRHELAVREYRIFLQRLKIISKKYIKEKERFINEIEILLKKMNIEIPNKDSVDKFYTSLLEIENRGIEFYGIYATQTAFSKIFTNQINTIGFEQNGEVVFEEKDRYFSVQFSNHLINDMTKTNGGVSKITPIYITTSDLDECVANDRQMYYLGVADGISFANRELNNLLYKENDLSKLTAEMFEKMMSQKKEFESIVDEVVNGKLIIEDQKLIFHDNWCNGTIEFSNIASGLKIFIILQRLINNGSFLDDSVLIIDEPETNLHPEWQIKLAQLLVLLNKKIGLRMYLNSHSPYFVRAMEYFSHQYDIVEKCHFYFMKANEENGMFQSMDVTEQLGIIYDKLAEPFNLVM